MFSIYFLIYNKCFYLNSPKLFLFLLAYIELKLQKGNFFLIILISIFLPIIIFIAPINVKAIQGNLDLSSAQTSVGKRFAKVFCDAKREGLDSDFASEYALNNTYLKFVAFPDDDEYLADLWNFTHKNIFCLLYTSPSPRD